MWIETLSLSASCSAFGNSFASNGECGLKPIEFECAVNVCRNSFASNGECGLKHNWNGGMNVPSTQFIRQQWRMWIETEQLPMHHVPPALNSFASNGECGLKQEHNTPHHHRNTEFIRQQWRMWIETKTQAGSSRVYGNSFASNGECGLKHCSGYHVIKVHSKFIRQQWRMWIETRKRTDDDPCSVGIHSPAMANVD